MFLFMPEGLVRRTSEITCGEFGVSLAINGKVVGNARGFAGVDDGVWIGAGISSDKAGPAWEGRIDNLLISVPR